MPIFKDGSGQIQYTAPHNKDRLVQTNVAEDIDFAVSDTNNVIKQIKFDVVPTGTTTVTGTTTIRVEVPDGDTVIDLTAIGTPVHSFSTMQPDLGTSPVASTGADTLTLTSPSSNIHITGNSTTDTLSFDAWVSATNRLLGRFSSGAGAYEEIQIDGNLQLIAGVLSIVGLSGNIDGGTPGAVFFAGGTINGGTP